jgi:hypothetical protein
MQRSFNIANIRKLFLLVFCVFIFGASSVSTAQDEDVLVTGNPSLRQRDVTKSIVVFEFYFGGNFTKKQRRDYQEYVETAWKNGDSQIMRDVAAIISLHELISESDEEKLSILREKHQPRLLRILEINRGKIFYSHLLDVYEEIKETR